MRAPRPGGDVLTIGTVAGASTKKYPLAPVAQNISYETVSDQPEAQPNQPVSARISFHGGLAYDHYDERTGGCLVSTGVLCNEPNVFRAPVKVNTVTLTDADAPPMYFFEAGLTSAAAITLDADSSSSVASSTTLTFSHTVGSGNDRLLVVAVQAAGFIPHTVTYGGTSLTGRAGDKNTSGALWVQLWYLLAPASGAADIVVTVSTASAICATASSWENVDQVTPFGSSAKDSGTGTAVSITAQTTTGEVVIDSVVAYEAPTFTVGADQTEVKNTGGVAADSTVRGASSYQAGADGGVMTWTLGASKPWAAVALPILPHTGEVLYAISAEAGEVNAYKVSLNDANFGTLLNTKTWAGVTTSPMGRPAEWTSGGNTYWLVPLGDSGLIDSLTTIAASTSNDTWSGGTDADARHLLVVKNQLYRTTGANEVSILPRNTDPETEAGWGDEFYFGDAGFKITDIAQVAGQIMAPKEDGLWEFDGVAEAVNVLPELGIAERNGQGLSYGRGGFFIPGVAGLYWTRTGEPIGPESHDDYHIANDPSIGAGEYFKHGRWMGTANYNGHLYGLYVNSVGTTALVVWGYPVGNEWRFYALALVTADFDNFHGIYVSETSKFSASEVRPCLWFANGNNLSYIWLDKNGAPMLRRGDIDVASAATATSGRIDFGYPRVLKQLRYISGWAEDMVASNTFTLRVYRDGGTVESVPPTSSTITTDGYFSQYWTQDTNDTCRSLLFNAVWFAQGDTTDLNGPLVRDIQLHAVLLPAVTRVWTFLVHAEDDTMRTAKKIRTEMEGYTNDLKKFELPDGDSLNGVLTGIRMLRANEIRELAVDKDDKGKALPLPKYIMVATVREMPTS